MKIPMRLLPIAALVTVVSLASPASAGVFGGFGGREDGYLVGSDKICTPLAVEAGKASGTPACSKASDDQVAQLSVKTPKAVHGRDASHTAASKGRTIEVTATKKEVVVVTWEAPDPISRIDDVYVSQYGNLIAVEYSVRRGSRDVAEVVVFDVRGAASSGAVTDPPPVTDRPPVVAPPAASPALTKALKAARKAKKSSAAKALKAWNKVLAIDPDHSEARYGVAVAHARAKKKDLAIAALEGLAATGRSDAMEYLILARFEKAFAAVRADAKFRTAVGLDGGSDDFYERLMGKGGSWEQPETACDTPGVTLTLGQDRSFKLVIRSTCSGDRWKDTFKGRWEAKEPGLTLILPNKGRDDESFDCQVEKDGDEDAIRCALDADLSFVVRPVRR
jgi:hypothetical protein